MRSLLKVEVLTLDNQLPGFTSIPKPKDSTVNLHLAALIAHIEIGKELIFSEDKIVTYRDSLFDQWEAQTQRNFIYQKTMRWMWLTI